MSAEPPISAGASASGFILERLLGRDQCGDVWLGRRVTGESAAVRFLPLDPASDQGLFSFLKWEATVQHRLAQECSHVVPVVETHRGGPASRPFIATAFVDGETLDQRLERRGKLTPEQAEPVIRQVLEALATAHRRGHVHGNLNASNVLLDHNDKVFVTDFGIAQVMGSRWGSRGRTEIDLANPAPNETHGEGLSCQTDLEAFGCLCYQMLTGRTPASGYGLVRALNPHVPEQLASFVDRLMAPEPQDRFPSYVAVRAELVARFSMKTPHR
jgi:serine/threonine-protein kinase